MAWLNPSHVPSWYKIFYLHCPRPIYRGNKFFGSKMKKLDNFNTRV